MEIVIALGVAILTIGVALALAYRGVDPIAFFGGGLFGVGLSILGLVATSMAGDRS